MKIKFTPVLRAINRLNTGAFTDYELYYDPKMGSGSLAERELAKGTVLYNNVVKEVCDNLGLSFDKITHTFSQSE